MIVEAVVFECPVGVQPPDAGFRRGRDLFDRSIGPFDDELAPFVDVLRVGLAAVEVVDIELELDIGEFEQVEKEQGRVGVRERGMIGHRARS